MADKMFYWIGVGVVSLAALMLVAISTERLIEWFLHRGKVYAAFIDFLVQRSREKDEAIRRHGRPKEKQDADP